MDATKEPMSKDEAKFYRRCAAKLNHMALDRPDHCVAANLLSRAMANPKKGDEKLIKRVCRNLRRHPACVIQYKVAISSWYRRCAHRQRLGWLQGDEAQYEWLVFGVNISCNFASLFQKCGAVV